jgi:hypothetical protein
MDGSFSAVASGASGSSSFGICDGAVSPPRRACRPERVILCRRSEQTSKFFQTPEIDGNNPSKSRPKSRRSTLIQRQDQKKCEKRPTQNDPSTHLLQKSSQRSMDSQHARRADDLTLHKVASKKAIVKHQPHGISNNICNIVMLPPISSQKLYSIMQAKKSNHVQCLACGVLNGYNSRPITSFYFLYHLLAVAYSSNSSIAGFNSAFCIS